MTVIFLEIAEENFEFLNSLVFEEGYDSDLYIGGCRMLRHAVDIFLSPLFFSLRPASCFGSYRKFV